MIRRLKSVKCCICFLNCSQDLILQPRCLLYILELNGKRLLFEGTWIFFKGQNRSVVGRVGEVRRESIVAKLHKLFIEGFVKSLKTQRESAILVLHLREHLQAVVDIVVGFFI